MNGCVIYVNGEIVEAEIIAQEVLRLGMLPLFKEIAEGHARNCAITAAAERVAIERTLIAQMAAKGIPGLLSTS